MASILQCEKLEKHYGRRVGIQDVTLSVAEGEIYGFLGPNGAGKTTTIRLILGLVRPTAGGVEVFGLKAWRHSKHIKRDVGYLPADLRLYSWMTPASAVAVFSRIRGIDFRVQGRNLADRLQLDWYLNVCRMSRGMRQKLGLILAIAHQPRLLILDEPTSGLDPLMQQELASLLREMKRAGHTIFFSSHTLSEVEDLCQRVAIVRKGCTVAEESLAALRVRARREVLIIFPSSAVSDQIAPPTFLEKVAKEGARWRAEMTGSAQPLVQWAAQQPIQDLDIGPPDLNTVFRSYYAQPAAESMEFPFSKSCRARDDEP